MADSKGKMLTLDDLQSAVGGGAVAIRGRATLQPAGGPGDKVFPPTHSVDDKRAVSRYATERRRIHGGEVDCVLLDSVQSQANRMEEALQALWSDKRITLPVIEVDFSGCAPEIGVITSLTAPHRVADALLRDSQDADGTFFRMSAIGKSFTDATVRHAAPLFKVCPTGLVFGIWDSTGPKGGLGSKFARALVSEITGVDATLGVKTASRIDPTGIITKAAEIYVAKDAQQGWTHDPALAKQEKGAPVKLGDGKVSEVNHSNIPPTVDPLAGGVTIDHASHSVVLSLAALRRLEFGEGSVQARTVLAALGLLAVMAAESRGHDLRSRCLLVPEPGKSLSLEIVSGDGSVSPLALDLETAVQLYETAVAALPKALQFGVKQGEALVKLKPSAKLAHLVTKSRELAGAGVDTEAT
jgi:CRISPR-associated protein Csb1